MWIRAQISPLGAEEGGSEPPGALVPRLTSASHLILLLQMRKLLLGSHGAEADSRPSTARLLHPSPAPGQASTPGARPGAPRLSAVAADRRLQPRDPRPSGLCCERPEGRKHRPGLGRSPIWKKHTFQSSGATCEYRGAGGWVPSQPQRQPFQRDGRLEEKEAGRRPLAAAARRRGGLVPGLPLKHTDWLSDPRCTLAIVPDVVYKHHLRPGVKMQSPGFRPEGFQV